MAFEVLFVCTGNVCRSPMAEHLFAHRLSQRLGDAAKDFRVASAGTGALAGEPMTSYAGEVLGELGVGAAATDAFRGRQLAEDHICGADLVLTATRDHRMQVAQMVPAATPRTFTITEFALLVGAVDPATVSASDPVDRARELTEAALSLRGTVQPESPRALDVADPYQLSLSVFRDAGAQLDQAITVIADAIAG